MMPTTSRPIHTMRTRMNPPPTPPMTMYIVYRVSMLESLVGFEDGGMAMGVVSPGASVVTLPPSVLRGVATEGVAGTTSTEVVDTIGGGTER